MAILDKVRNYMESRIILTGAELDIFTLIHRKISTADEIAQKLNADKRGTARLLDALTVFGILEKKDFKYSIKPEFFTLSSDHPESVLPMVLHMNDLWDSWTYLTEAVIEGKNPGKTDFPDDFEKNTRSFIGAMHVAGKNLSLKIASSLDLSEFKKLLDIGGASGTYTIAFLEKNPLMKSIVFDLPQVIDFSKKGIEAAGLSDRVEFETGDYNFSELPKGCDLALLSAIIHQNSPKENLELFRKIYNAIKPGGMLVIRDHIMDSTRTKPALGSVFAINMLVATNGGDTYTFEEVKNFLEKSGFKDVLFELQGENMDCLVTCRK
ncbi:MAG: methyltransferase [Desulforegulaceae bacterium]|nr:methyltransferase [Desulforegulaceae bacterium]